MSTQEMTLEQIRATGLQVLSRELGTTGLIRFLQMFETGEGDYTKERHRRLAPETAVAVAAKIDEHLNLSEQPQ